MSHIALIDVSVTQQLFTVGYVAMAVVAVVIIQYSVLVVRTGYKEV